MRRAAASVIVLIALIVRPDPAGAVTGRRVGDVGAVALPVSGVLVAAIHKDLKGAWELAEAYAATMAITYALKPTIDRERPDGGRQSFPSGHTASAFAGAGFLQRRYGWSYGAPAYAAASFVGYSRVAAKRHWTSDVIAGGALGVASNLIFTKRFKKAAVYPVVQADLLAVTIEVRW